MYVVFILIFICFAFFLNFIVRLIRKFDIFQIFVRIFSLILSFSKNFQIFFFHFFFFCSDCFFDDSDVDIRSIFFIVENVIDLMKNNKCLFFCFFDDGICIEMIDLLFSVLKNDCF